MTGPRAVGAVDPLGATIPEVTHHRVPVDGVDLHYVDAGDRGTPIVLVHGFPETWWAFHRLIPLLAAEHRVVAVDLPGFGDSGTDTGTFTNAFVTGCLRRLVATLDLGPVHLTGQDVGGASTFRLVAESPELVRSYTAIETVLPGFGFDMLAAAAWHGRMLAAAAWHGRMLAEPGIPEMLLAGREREFLTRYAFPSMCATPGAIADADVDEFVRAYSRPGGLTGIHSVYRSLLAEGEQIRALVADRRVAVPVLAVGAGTGDATRAGMEQVAEDVTPVQLDGIGHLAAIEDPGALADALLGFYRRLDV